MKDKYFKLSIKWLEKVKDIITIEKKEEKDCDDGDIVHRFAGYYSVGVNRVFLHTGLWEYKGHSKIFYKANLIEYIKIKNTVNMILEYEKNKDLLN